MLHKVTFCKVCQLYCICYIIRNISSIKPSTHDFSCHILHFHKVRLKWITTVSGVLQNSWIQMTDCRNVVTISSHFGVCCVSRLTYHSLRHGPRWVSISQIVFINRSSTNVIWDLFFGLPDRILPDRIFVIIKCNWLFVSLVLPQELPYKCLISGVFLFCSECHGQSSPPH